MEVLFDIYDEESHLCYIEEWERQGEIYLFLSHTRPRCLRENDDSARLCTKLFMIKHEDVFIGSAWLEEITKNDAKLGIYIAEKGARGKGIGEKTVRYLVKVAFEELRLYKVYLNVRGSNERAINCYKKCGFKIVKKYENKLLADGIYHEVYEMAVCKE